MGESPAIAAARDLRVKLEMDYQVLDDPDPESFLPQVQVLLRRLGKAGQLRELHEDDSEYTWFKLNEWMQVEILEIYASSLSHTPWCECSNGRLFG